MRKRRLRIRQVRNSPADVISVLKAIFGEVFYIATAPAIFRFCGRSGARVRACDYAPARTPTPARGGRPSLRLLLHAVDEAGEFEGAVARIKLVEIAQLAPPPLLP